MFDVCGISKSLIMSFRKYSSVKKATFFLGLVLGDYLKCNLDRFFPKTLYMGSSLSTFEIIKMSSCENRS